MMEQTNEEILFGFANKLIASQQEISTEFIDIINENFWELLETDEKDENYDKRRVNS